MAQWRFYSANVSLFLLNLCSVVDKKAGRKPPDLTLIINSAGLMAHTD